MEGWRAKLFLLALFLSCLIFGETFVAGQNTSDGSLSIDQIDADSVAQLQEKDNSSTSQKANCNIKCTGNLKSRYMALATKLKTEIEQLKATSKFTNGDSETINIISNKHRSHLKLAEALKYWEDAQEDLKKSLWTKSMRHLQTIVTLFPEDSFEAKCLIAECYLTLGDQDRALQTYLDIHRSSRQGTSVNRLLVLGINVRIGDLYLAKKMPDDALKFYHSVLGMEPNCGLAHRGVATSLEMRLQEGNGDANFEQGITSDNTDDSESTATSLIDLSYVPEDIVEILLNHYVQAIKQGADNQDVRIRTGALYALREEWVAAASHLEEAVKQQPTMWQSHFLLATVLEKRGRIIELYGRKPDTTASNRLIQKALSHYQQANWLNSHFFLARFYLASLLFELERYAESFDQIQYASDLGCKYCSSMFTKKRSQIKEDEGEIVSSGNAKCCHTCCINAHLLRARIASQLHRTQDAIDSYQKVKNQMEVLGLTSTERLESVSNLVSPLPNSIGITTMSDIMKELANLLVKHRQFKSAEAILLKLLESEKGKKALSVDDMVYLYKLHADVLLGLGSVEQAKKALLKSLELNPENGEINLQLGILSDKNDTEALLYFEKAFELGADTLAARIRTCSILIDRQDYNGAASYLTITVRKWPHSSRAHAMLASTLLKKHQIDGEYSDKGVEFEEKVTHLSPKKSVSSVRIKNTKEIYPNCSENQSFSIAPLHDEKLDIKHASRDTITQAISLFKHATMLDGKCTYCHVALGELYLAIDQPHNAIDSLEISLKQASDHSKARILMGDAKSRVNEFDTALKNYKAAMKNTTITSVAMSRASVTYLQMGKVEEAEKSLVNAISANSFNIVAHRALLVVRMCMGKYYDYSEEDLFKQKNNESDTPEKVKHDDKSDDKPEETSWVSSVSKALGRFGNLISTPLSNASDTISSSKVQNSSLKSFGNMDEYFIKGLSTCYMTTLLPGFDSDVILFNLGKNLAFIENYYEAIGCYEMILKRDTSKFSIFALLELINLLYKTGNVEAIHNYIKELETKLTENGNYIEENKPFILACSLWKLRALSINPQMETKATLIKIVTDVTKRFDTFPAAYYVMGKEFLSMELYQDAFEALGKSLTLLEQDLLKMGRQKLEDGVLRIEKMQMVAELRLLLARSLIGLSKYDKALDNLKTAKDLVKDFKMHMDRVLHKASSEKLRADWNIVDKHRYEQQDFLHIVAASYPNRFLLNSNILIECGLIYYRTGEFQLAADQLLEAIQSIHAYNFASSMLNRDVETSKSNFSNLELMNFDWIEASVTSDLQAAINYQKYASSWTVQSPHLLSEQQVLANDAASRALIILAQVLSEDQQKGLALILNIGAVRASSSKLKELEARNSLYSVLSSTNNVYDSVLNAEYLLEKNSSVDSILLIALEQHVDFLQKIGDPNAALQLSQRILSHTENEYQRKRMQTYLETLVTEKATLEEIISLLSKADHSFENQENLMNVALNIGKSDVGLKKKIQFLAAKHFFDLINNQTMETKAASHLSKDAAKWLDLMRDSSVNSENSLAEVTTPIAFEVSSRLVAKGHAKAAKNILYKGLGSELEQILHNSQLTVEALLKLMPAMAMNICSPKDFKYNIWPVISLETRKVFRLLAKLEQEDGAIERTLILLWLLMLSENFSSIDSCAGMHLELSKTTFELSQHWKEKGYNNSQELLSQALYHAEYASSLFQSEPIHEEKDESCHERENSSRNIDERNEALLFKSFLLLESGSINQATESLLNVSSTCILSREIGIIYALFLQNKTESALKRYNEIRSVMDVRLETENISCEVSYYWKYTFHIGVVLNRLKLYNDSVRLLRLAARSKPDEANVHHLLGTVYYHLSDWENSKIESLHAVELDPSNLNALNNLGAVYFEMSEHQQAVKTFNRILALCNERHTPDHASHCKSTARMNLGLAYEALGSFDEASVHLQKAVAWLKLLIDDKGLRSKDTSAHFAKLVQVQRQYARILLLKQNVPGAIALLRDVLKTFKYMNKDLKVYIHDNTEIIIEILREISQLYLQTKQNENAIHVLYQVVLLRGGVEFSMLAKKQTNDIVLRDAIVQKLETPGSLVELGNALLLSGKLNEAKYVYEKSRKLFPNDSVSLNNLGVISYKQGEWKQAVKWFQEALKRDSTNAEARAALKMLTNNHGSSSAAKKVAKEG